MQQMQYTYVNVCIYVFIISNGLVIVTVYFSVDRGEYSYPWLKSKFYAH